MMDFSGNYRKERENRAGARADSARAPELSGARNPVARTRALRRAFSRLPAIEASAGDPRQQEGDGV
jgi:hypothetical protein